MYLSLSLSFSLFLYVCVCVCEWVYFGMSCFKFEIFYVVYWKINWKFKTDA